MTQPVITSDTDSETSTTDMGDHYLIEQGWPTLANPSICHSLRVEWKPGTPGADLQNAQDSIQAAVPQLAPGLQQAQADLALLQSGNVAQADLLAIVGRLVQGLATVAQMTSDLAVHTAAIPPVG